MDFLLLQLGGADIEWTSLVHNGVLFPPDYVKHDVPVIYEGKSIVLNTDAEELATMYAKYIDTPYVDNRVFNKNFWQAWKTALGTQTPIQSLAETDFSLIQQYLIDQKVVRSENAQAIKEAKLQEEEPYKYAYVDGKQEAVGNFRIEPPGIFLGRGCNPNLGKIKPRIYPEDITINISEDAPIPKTLPGHTWKKVVHDHTGLWLASWKDIITGKTKYVRLANDSTWKKESDMSKFDLARKLKKRVKKIREQNEKLLTSDDPTERQLATALYFIDNYALRIGHEKGKDSADTVGVLSLRTEHIKLLDDDKIKLDFLGKDSVRYNRTVEVPKDVYVNVRNMMSNKTKKDKLFDLITPAALNRYLKNYMDGLTSKVFRTYNASHLYAKELSKLDKKIKDYTAADRLNVILDSINKANAKVAMLCNHQKNVNANLKDQLDVLDDKIKKAKKRVRELRAKTKPNKDQIERAQIALKKLRAKKEMKIQLKNISLGTSKINYIDPRITIAFIKRHDIPIDKIFTKTLQEKFQWAMDLAGPDFKF